MTNLTPNTNTLEVGTEIYYTGDIANADGFGEIVETVASRMTKTIGIRFKDGREMTVRAVQIGAEYHGHCNPRFVTRAAYDAYYNQRTANVAGRDAFLAGKKCIPCQDSAMMDMIKKNPDKQVGGSIAILGAWRKGWTTANLAAPVIL